VDLDSTPHYANLKNFNLKYVGLEANTEKTKYELIFRHQNAGQNHNINIASKLLKNVAHFKYLGTTATDPEFILEEIKSRLNSCNVSYHSIQNILYSSPLSEKVIIRINKTVVLPVVLYMCEIGL
jgi:hypothetical protein